MRLLAASWAILASEVRPGRRLRPVLGAFWSRHGAIGGVYGELLGGFEAPGGLPGVILLAQSAIFSCGSPSRMLLNSRILIDFVL